MLDYKPAKPTDGLFTAQEFLDRQSRIADALPSVNCQALVTFANKVHAGNTRYLTGYETRLGIHDCALCLFVPESASPCTLFTNSSWDAPQPSPWLNEVVLTSDFAREIVARLPANVRRVAVAGWRALPAPLYLDLDERLEGKEIVDISDLLLNLRLIKSPAEIEALRRSEALAEVGARAFLAGVQEGVSEREIAAAVESAVTLAGSEGFGYGMQVSSGERTAETVAFASHRRLEAGDLVGLDCGPLYEGYHSDFSRTTVVGRPSKQLLQLLEVTADMFEAAMAVIRPAATGADVARAAVAVAESHGLEELMYESPYVARGFLGHGIGVNYHELPMIGLSSETILQKDVVLVLEPILRIPGIGGTKIENMVLVTADGAEQFSALTLRPWREN